jgi:hypothetical protein
MPRRLTDWARLKQLFVAGWSQAQLAEHFSIPKGSIAARCARQKWAWWRPEVLLQQQLKGKTK